jgi:hypothetical protein
MRVTKSYPCVSTGLSRNPLSESRQARIETSGGTQPALDPETDPPPAAAPTLDRAAYTANMKPSPVQPVQWLNVS